MTDVRYGYTDDPKHDGYSAGPALTPEELMRPAGITVGAEIHQLSPFDEPVPLYRWLDGEWHKIGEQNVTENSESYEVERPEPFERDERAKLVLGELQLSGKENEVMMVSCKVVGFTAEAKVQTAQYEQARGYIQLEPKDLWIHVPILNPGQKVTNSGDVEIFGAVFRYIARELDMAVFNVASERVDLRTSIKDAAEVKATSRFDTGRKVVQTKTEVL